MKGIKDFLSGKKTYILGALGIAGTIMAWATDAMTGLQAIEAVGAALGLLFLRMGVTKSAP